MGGSDDELEELASDKRREATSRPLAVSPNASSPASSSRFSTLLCQPIVLHLGFKGLTDYIPPVKISSPSQATTIVVNTPLDDFQGFQLTSRNASFSPISSRSITVLGIVTRRKRGYQLDNLAASILCFVRSGERGRSAGSADGTGTGI